MELFHCMFATKMLLQFCLKKKKWSIYPQQTPFTPLYIQGRWNNLSPPLNEAAQCTKDTTLTIIFLVCRQKVSTDRAHSSPVTHQASTGFHAHLHVPPNIVTSHKLSTWPSRGPVLTWWYAWWSESEYSVFECSLAHLNTADLTRYQRTYPPCLALLLCFRKWDKQGGHSSGFSREILFVTFWLAAAARVIDSLKTSYDEFIGY